MSPLVQHVGRELGQMEEDHNTEHVDHQSMLNIPEQV